MFDINAPNMPREYCAWLKEHCDAACEEETGIYLYAEEDINERNETYECEEYLPNYLIIGDDSGDTLFVMKKEPTARAVYTTDMGDMNEAHLKKETDNFLKWVERLNLTFFEA